MISAQNTVPSVNSVEKSPANEISAIPLPPGIGIYDVAKEHKKDIERIVITLTPPFGLNAKYTKKAIIAREISSITESRNSPIINQGFLIRYLKDF